MQVDVPCGRCHGCRLDYSKQWALRCMHEAQLHESNSFLTLTYDNEHLPSDRSVHKEDLQRFFRRFRKHYGYRKLRYFGCGEYGDKSGRPHYHLILFGHDFSDDRYLWSLSGDHPLYRSPTLEKLWFEGHSAIAEVSFDTCAYTARYVMKKRKGKPDEIDPKTGKTNAQYYEALCEDTGEIIEIEPEFCLMSKRPGIGKEWFDNFKGDLDKDFVTFKGKKSSIPTYYDKLLEAEDPEEFMERKKRRIAKAKERAEDNTLDRLRVKEVCSIAKTESLERTL